MSRRIIRDVEEALTREVRRVTFHEQRTLDTTVLQDTFDPFTGDIVQTPVEPSFYDSSADTNHIQYPHLFIKLLKTREDRFTGRIIPEYGQNIQVDVETAPKAYDIVLSSSDGAIATPGASFTTSIYNIRKAQPGQYLRLLTGNNIGTYIIDTITINNSGPHTLTVTSQLLASLSAIVFDSGLRKVAFLGPVDLSTVKIGDSFIDSASTSFPITAVDAVNGFLTLGSTGNPNLAANSQITRSGNVFQNTDLSLVRWLILDPTKPVEAVGNSGATKSTSIENASPSIPLDLYYLIRIDSKERATHIDILNRVWEEFNPPRTGLPIVVRSALSAEQLLTQDIPSGGSQTVNVANNSEFNVGDTVFIFDDLRPTKSSYGFLEPFTAVVQNKIGTSQIVLTETVPDIYLVSNTAKIVSNATFELNMFHFVDHVTKDIDSAQYFVHEFTFWVQVWVDRLETPTNTGVIKQIEDPVEDLQGNVYL